MWEAICGKEFIVTIEWNQALGLQIIQGKILRIPPRNSTPHKPQRYLSAQKLKEVEELFRPSPLMNTKGSFLSLMRVFFSTQNRHYCLSTVPLKVIFYYQAVSPLQHVLRPLIAIETVESNT